MSTDKDASVDRLVEIGRGLGASRIQEAVESAENQNQMVNQLFILNVMSTHIIATHIANEVILHEREIKVMLEKQFQLIANEVTFLLENSDDLEVAKTKDCPDDPEADTQLH